MTIAELLADGPYLSTLYPSTEARRPRTGGTRVRVIGYTLPDHPGRPAFRLLISLLEAPHHPAETLAAPYPERWEIEGALEELKTYLRGDRIVLRSKTPHLVEQELYGLVLAHRAVRSLILHAAPSDPDKLSRTHTVRGGRGKRASARPALAP